MGLSFEQRKNNALEKELSDSNVSNESINSLGERNEMSNGFETTQPFDILVRNILKK